MVGHGGILVFRTYLERSGTGGQEAGELSPWSGHGMELPQEQFEFSNPSRLAVNRVRYTYIRRDPSKKAASIDFVPERRI